MNSTELHSQKPIRLALRSYHFIAGTFLMALDIIGAIVLILRELNRLPFGAQVTLVAGIILAVTFWRLALRQHERISLVLASRDSKNLVLPLSFCADCIERGLLIGSVMILMFLGALAFVLR